MNTQPQGGDKVFSANPTSERAAQHLRTLADRQRQKQQDRASEATLQQKWAAYHQEQVELLHSQYRQQLANHDTEANALRDQLATAQERSAQRESEWAARDAQEDAARDRWKQVAAMANQRQFLQAGVAYCVGVALTFGLLKLRGATS